MDDAVEDRVGHGGVADDLMPVLDGAQEKGILTGMVFELFEDPESCGGLACAVIIDSSPALPAQATGLHELYEERGGAVLLAQLLV